MAVNWEDELKRYIRKNFKEKMGVELPNTDIIIEDVSFDMDLTVLNITDLTRVYSFAIMKEDFEAASIVKTEFENRNCRLKLINDDKTKTAMLKVFEKYKRKPSIEYEFKILPDGLLVDFEKNNF